MEKEAEFFNYVSIDDIAEQFECDRSEIESIFHYWKLKRRANGNRPLLTPRVQNQEKVTDEENSPFTFMKKLVLRRRDLERARNLCYMVKNREKLVKKWLQTKEEIFDKQVSILRKQHKKLTEEQLTAVLNSNYGDLAYDKKYSGVNGPSPNMVSVLTNLVGEDLMRTKANGHIKTSQKNEKSKSVRTPNPYAKHYLNGLFVRTQRSISTANKQRKVQFQSDTSCQEETDNSSCNFQCDASNSVSFDVSVDSIELTRDQQFSPEAAEVISDEFSIETTFRNKCSSESSLLIKSCEENGSSSSITSPETDTRLCSSFDKSILVETDSGIDNTNGDVYSANSPAELNSDSNVVIETTMQSTDSEKSFYEFGSGSNIKLEKQDPVYVPDNLDTNDIKLEESEVIFMPDLDVGANYKMEQTNDTLGINEIYNHQNYPCDNSDASNLYDLNTDTNVVIEDCIYDVEVDYSNCQEYIENDIVNNTNPDICDTKMNNLDIKVNLQSTGLNGEVEHLKDIFKSDELSSVSCNGIKDEEQLIDSKIQNYKCSKEKSSENSLLASVENNSTVKAELCNNSVIEALKNTSKDVHKIKSKKLKPVTYNKLVHSTKDNNNFSGISKELSTGKLKVKVEECNLNDSNENNKSKTETNTNSKSNTNTFEIEKTLKLEVKKNNNRVLPLPYVVLKPADVVKCLNEGESLKCPKKENILNTNSTENKEGSEKLNHKKSKVNGLVKKTSHHDLNVNKKVKSDKLYIKGSPLRTSSPTSMKFVENNVLKSSKATKKKFNPESSAVFSKQPVVKLKNLNNLHTSSVLKQSKCQEKAESNSKPPESAQSQEKVESVTSDSKSHLFPFDKTLPPIPNKDSFKGYKIPKKQPQTQKPEENSLDSRRGSIHRSPLPDITPVSLSGYQNKTSWRKLEPRSEKVTFNKPPPPPPVKTSDMYSQEVPSERLVLKLTKDTTDPESMRWKTDPNSYDRNNCRRNWSLRHVPPLMPPPPPPYPQLLNGGSWPYRANQVNFRQIHNNYSHGPFS